MKFSEKWLRSYVNPAISTEELLAQITMAGLEVDSVEPAAAQFSGVVVGQVIEMQQHPDADRLRVCRVNVGQDELLQIVCGAANARIGLKIPAALIGAVLPGDFKIKKSKLRGVESFGMLCSAKELGIAVDADGLMELSQDAPVGQDIREYLLLDDNIIEVDLTPNRADCLSVEGIAREVAVLNNLTHSSIVIDTVSITEKTTLPVRIEAVEACPRYFGRIISGVNNQAETPLWMQERLRRSGLRSLSPLVDVTNYVLLELGQPLHVFDANKLTGGITVRYAQSEEKLTLLNEQSITLDDNLLIIADDKQPLAFAGVMGGNDSAVDENTQTIFLECAFFNPTAIAGKARQFGLHTDSSHRFERGVDFELQNRAIERATQLILEIAGGQAGAITAVEDEQHFPKRDMIFLRKTRLENVLGISFADEIVTTILRNLGMQVDVKNDGWQVLPPSFRFDMAIEADLIEEIARIYGYNNLPNNHIINRAQLNQATESVVELDRLKDVLVDCGYQEAITYSFVDEKMQQTIAPNDQLIRLQNPISAELSVMRTTLWCGLLNAALHNINRQQSRVRLFETGLRFIQNGDEIVQQKMLAGLVLGASHAEQWGYKSRQVDFFDVKADLEALFHVTRQKIQFVSAQHEALHPYQTAKLLTEANEELGWFGMLHPNLEKQLGFNSPVFLFELAQNLLLPKTKVSFKSLSKYPSVRRDLALLVNQDIAVSQIIDIIKSNHEVLLQEIIVFDVYQGKGIEENKKSIGLGLIFQDEKQTLIDEDIDKAINRFLSSLQEQINVTLRD